MKIQKVGVVFFLKQAFSNFITLQLFKIHSTRQKRHTNSNVVQSSLLSQYFSTKCLKSPKLLQQSQVFEIGLSKSSIVQLGKKGRKKVATIH